MDFSQVEQASLNKKSTHTQTHNRVQFNSQSGRADVSWRQSSHRSRDRFMIVFIFPITERSVDKRRKTIQRKERSMLLALKRLRRTTKLRITQKAFTKEATIPCMSMSHEWQKYKTNSKMTEVQENKEIRKWLNKMFYTFKVTLIAR